MRRERATKPADISRHGWIEVLRSAWSNGAEHQLPAAAAAAAFYGFLAFVPAVAAFGSAWGLIGDADDLSQKVDAFQDMVPSSVLELVRMEALRFTHGTPAHLVMATAFFTVVSIAAASSSLRALMIGLNTAFRQKETRPWWHRQALAVAFAIALAAALAGEIVIASRASSISPDQDLWVALPGIAWRWAALVAASVAFLSVLYRYGADRRKARWRWVTPGSVTAALAGLVASVAVSLYVEHLAQYERVYGDLGPVLGLVIWLWTAMMVVLAGAELNWAIECKTTVDTSAPDDPDARTAET
ncbi:YihY/virulence factor BrkB family protein [uncultured Brevundimonas sp.]|uniref:YihY/virulence factor BrkB family protein n=1 Tax=uncultured Brevundimonas sp. TaxID=213418 RepID=UPI0030EE2DD7